MCALNIAVSASDFNDYGCPYCSGIYGYSNLSGNGATIWNCSDCNQTCVILADDITVSPVGIGDYHPTVQPHPRQEKKIDREALKREREQKLENDEVALLTKWLGIGFGHPLTTKVVGGHSSKSRQLPIVSAKTKDSNVGVTWFGQNYHFHFLGVKLTEPVNGLLLYPISTVFGGYALSGHVNRSLAPPVGCFEKVYYGQSPVQCFGVDCGDGFMSSLVIRYLQEVSKLDVERLLDICLRKTRYGMMEAIDGNAIEFDDLTASIGLARTEGKSSPYEFDVSVNQDGIFEKVEIDWYDTELGKASVQVTLKEGCLLPALPIPANTIYVDPLDTVLDQYLPDDAQKRPPRKSIDKVIKKVPVNIMKRREIGNEDYRELQGSKYPANYCYSITGFNTRNFTINVSNVLDASMVAFFLTKVLDPVIKMVLSE